MTLRDAPSKVQIVRAELSPLRRMMMPGGYVSFRAVCEGNRYCGTIEAKHGVVADRDVLVVDGIYVPARARRQGIATKLYEAALAEACSQRRFLASTNRVPGAHSHDFWAKQIAKGRAVAVPGTETIVMRSCATLDLSGARARRGKR